MTHFVTQGLKNSKICFYIYVSQKQKIKNSKVCMC